MKKIYFTENNINNKSEEFLTFLQSNLKIKNNKLDLNSSALIVIDMQNYFLEESSHACVPSGKTIITNINNLIELFYQNNQPVIFTKHINNKENAKMMGSWWKELITTEHELQNISKELNIQNSIIIQKSQYDAFYKTQLLNILKEKNIKQLVVVGVLTHLCCETTIRSAFMHGFETFFVIDSTATYNEEFHKSSFLNLSHGFTTPILNREIINAKN